MININHEGFLSFGARNNELDSIQRQYGHKNIIEYPETDISSPVLPGQATGTDEMTEKTQWIRLRYDRCFAWLINHKIPWGR
jgi:hypothetical protein